MSVPSGLIDPLALRLVDPPNLLSPSAAILPAPLRADSANLILNPVELKLPVPVKLVAPFTLSVGTTASVPVACRSEFL